MHDDPKNFDEVTGAHFKFEDICKRLEPLTQSEKKIKSTNNIIKIKKKKTKIITLKEKVPIGKCFILLFFVIRVGDENLYIWKS